MGRTKKFTVRSEAAAWIPPLLFWGLSTISYPRSQLLEQIADRVHIGSAWLLLAEALLCYLVYRMCAAKGKGSSRPAQANLVTACFFGFVAVLTLLERLVHIVQDFIRG